MKIITLHFCKDFALFSAEVGISRFNLDMTGRFRHKDVWIISRKGVGEGPLAYMLLMQIISSLQGIQLQQ